MDFYEFMMLTEEEFRVAAPVPRRRLCDLQNPMEKLSDENFRKDYRFTKQGLHDFILVIEHGFQSSAKGVSLPILHKLLVFLTFTSTGSFQRLSGGLEGLSQPTVSKVIKEVSKVIVENIGAFIQWPTSQISSVKEQFYRIDGFPGVIGAIDCTHVRIQSPGGENAERYRNRKGYFSINCQAVCDANLIFTNINAKWYGSTHDTRIFNNSALCAYLESLGTSNGILLGDQGYPLTPYLMTPLRNPLDGPELGYNKCHKKTRLTIERAFGVLKRVFSCLKTGLRLKVGTSLKVIPACVCMYNFLRQRRILDTSDNEVDSELDSELEPMISRRRDFVRASAIRQQIIHLHFSTAQA